MSPLDLLKLDAAYGYGELMKALEGVSEAQAWAQLPNLGPDYLHSGGSIYSMALHVAGGKWMHGSVAFRGGEIRWRECAAQMDAFEPSWSAALDYLARAHEYWMASWAEIEDVEAMHPTNWQVGDCPALKIIQTVNQHDSYHAGQIAVLRYACPEADVPPPAEADDIRKYCRDSKWW